MQTLSLEEFPRRPVQRLHPFPNGWYVIELGSNLRRSDGDIFRFRRYRKQFYGEAQAA